MNPTTDTQTVPRRPDYFKWTAALVGAMAFVAVWRPQLLTGAVQTVSEFFYLKFDWLIMWLPLLAFAVGMAVALSPRWGNIRLGGADATPDFSFAAWMNMLFTAGIGVGIVFFGPIEALWHYFHSPIGVQATHLPAHQQVANAMSLALHVWGIPAWSLYMIAGLVMAYFTYQHRTECTPAAPIEYAFRRKKWAKPAGILITGLAVLSIAMSVSSSIAMAAAQIASGLKIISGSAVFDGTLWKTAVLAVLAALYIGGSVLPIEKGMRFLGNWTVYLSVLLLVFIFLVGPTHYFVSTMTVAIGNILTQTVHHSFELYLFHKRDWIVWYPMAYWVWWVTWAPFVGVFLAKISRGRTLREFVLASVLVPAGFIVIWFSVFSGFSLLDTLEGTGKLAEIAEKGDYEGTFYHLLNMLPLNDATKPLTVVLFLGFIVTTVTSAAISLGIMTGRDGRSESKTRAVVWGVLMTLIAYAVVVTGEIKGIKAVGSFAGFPFVLVMYLWFAALWRQLRQDTKS
ncbi:BCCT family transporter [Conchiformibius steedae]|uniref:Glycine/betaine ABC transporter n=1 Tax=Conchiformibius steedae TaxID=153493 RepID=A0A3P2A6E9_9NEIS|nr:BCCT family transporter [Conchiformibius steedae]RRD91007.1 glycine/betaine ABC transporter [Conchiformibius steedae]